MIGLYKDPKGEKVFDKYETPPFKFQQKQSQIDSITGTQTDSAPMKRTRELEAVTSKIQVFLMHELHHNYLTMTCIRSQCH